MASIKDRFSPEVIAGLTQAYSDDVNVTEEAVVEEPKVNPFTVIAPYEVDCEEGEVLFSSVFWTPKTIPDLPLRMFKADDWDPVAQNHIPSTDPDWVWNRPVLEAMALAFYNGDTTLLHGLAGTGKSCLPEQWCALLKIPFWRMNCNRETRESHFLGNPNVEPNENGTFTIKQDPTLLTDSLKYGGMFCEDEAFRHNSALVLQSLREKRNRYVILPDAPGRTADDRKLQAPEGKWWYALTDNTAGSGDETGIFDAEVQDASTLDRIDTTIEVPYLGKADERKVLQNKTGLNLEIINGMIDVAKMIRASFAKQVMMSTMSLRGLESWAQKIEQLGCIGRALELSWYNKLGKEDQKVVDDMFHRVFDDSIKEL